MQLAILIDLHNLFMMLNKDFGKTKAAIEQIMKMGKSRGTIVEARLFVPIYFYQSDAMWRWINTISLMGLEVEACSVSSRKTDDGRKMKDSVDSCVLMHIIRHVHKDIGPEIIVFVTGDGDFIKFATQAQNRGKKTEFWSVNIADTNMLIRQSGNFQEIEVPVEAENLFTSALAKRYNNLPVNEEERRRLNLVVNFANLQLPSQASEDMAITASERLGISHVEARQLVEMLIILNVAEVKPAIVRIIDVCYLHSLFQYLASDDGIKATQESVVKPQVD